MALADIKKLSTEFDKDVVSLYVPRPAIEANGEKWRILKKNLQQQLAEFEGRTDRIEAWLEGLELSDFLGLGKAAFQKDDTLRTADLNARPKAMIAGPDAAFVSPLIADIDNKAQGWIVEINRETPGLYFHDGQNLHDLSERLNAPEFEEVIERREIMNDVFFHSASRGGVGQSKFHSLGTDKSEEEDRTEEAYYRDVWSALQHVIPAQSQNVHIVGERGTVGHFAKLSPREDWNVVQHQAGNGIAGLDLTSVFGETSALPDDQQLTPMNSDDLSEAAKQGRIASIYMSNGSDLLELADEGATDEHLSLRRVKQDGEERLDDVVLHTLHNGGDIHFVPKAELESLVPLVETRW